MGAYLSFSGIFGVSCQDSVPTGHIVKERYRAGVDSENMRTSSISAVSSSMVESGKCKYNKQSFVNNDF